MIKREELLEEIEKLRGLKNCGERVIQKREEQLKRISAELEIKELCLSILDKQKGVLHPDNFFNQDSNKEFLVKELSTNRIGFIRNLSTACENRLWLNEYCVFVDGPEAHDMLNDFKLASGWYNGKEYKDGLEVTTNNERPFGPQADAHLEALGFRKAVKGDEVCLEVINWLGI